MAVVSATPPVRVWTDGACKGNPGPGGWAWIRADGVGDSGGEPETTNQRMEVTAAAEAMAAHPGPLEIISDSTYVVACFNKGWYKSWLRNGWRNAQRQPVANRDLWEPFITDYLARTDVEFTWVKGHSGDRMNERADVMAVAEAEKFGVAKPSAAVDGRRPEGWGCVVTGQRSLGAELYAKAVDRLCLVLAGYLAMHDDLVVVTGLRAGAEQAAAEAARRCDVPYVAVMPWPEAQARLPAVERQRFDHDLAGARSTVVLERKVPRDVAGRRQSLRRRDAWLARNSSAAIVVHDGRDPEGVQALGNMAPLGDDVWDLDLSL